MNQKDDGKTKQPTTGSGGSAKPAKPSPKFPPEIKTIGHGGGGVRTNVEVPKLPRVPTHGGSSVHTFVDEVKLPNEPSHGGGGIRPEKTDVDE